MKKYAVFTAVVFMLFWGSCFPPPRPGVLPVPPPRLHITGFSVLPFHEQGWIKLKQDDYGFSLAKSGRKQDETYALQAMLVNLPPLKTEDEFTRFVKKTTVMKSESERFLVLESRVGTLDGSSAEGVRFTHKILDRQAQKRSGDKGTMVLEVEGVVLKHPDNNLYGIHLAYSHRCYEGEEDASLPIRFEPMIQEIEFLNL